MKNLILNKNYIIELEDGKHEIRVLKFSETGVICFFVREWIACVKELPYNIFKDYNIEHNVDI
jgi:hypothetical protein